MGSQSLRGISLTEENPIVVVTGVNEEDGTSFDKI